MSAKNLLQEFCQKSKLDTPKYNTVRIGGDDHNPIWKADLMVFDKKFSSEGKTKKEAELNVADVAYKKIKKTKVTVVVKERENAPVISKVQKSTLEKINLSPFKNIILVDAENQDVDDKYLTSNTKDNMFMMFVAKNTSKNWVFRAQDNFKDSCYVFISQCVGKDAADHMLTFYLGKLSVLAPDKKYYILTKDHYGEYLPHFCPNSKFICSCDEL